MPNRPAKGGGGYRGSSGNSQLGAAIFGGPALNADFGKEPVEGGPVSKYGADRLYQDPTLMQRIFNRQGVDDANRQQAVMQVNQMVSKLDSERQLKNALTLQAGGHTNAIDMALRQSRQAGELQSEQLRNINLAAEETKLKDRIHAGTAALAGAPEFFAGRGMIAPEHAAAVLAVGQGDHGKQFGSDAYASWLKKTKAQDSLAMNIANAPGSLMTPIAELGQREAVANLGKRDANMSLLARDNPNAQGAVNAAYINPILATGSAAALQNKINTDESTLEAKISGQIAEANANIYKDQLTRLDIELMKSPEMQQLIAAGKVSTQVLANATLQDKIDLLKEHGADMRASTAGIMRVATMARAGQGDFLKSLAPFSNISMWGGQSTEVPGPPKIIGDMTLPGEPVKTYIPGTSTGGFGLTPEVIAARVAAAVTAGNATAPTTTPTTTPTTPTAASSAADAARIREIRARIEAGGKITGTGGPRPSFSPDSAATRKQLNEEATALERRIQAIVAAGSQSVPPSR